MLRPIRMLMLLEQLLISSSGCVAVSLRGPSLNLQCLQIAGQNIANPTAAILSTAMLLRHCNLPDFSDRSTPLPHPNSSLPCRHASNGLDSSKLCLLQTCPDVAPSLQWSVANPCGVCRMEKAIMHVINTGSNDVKTVDMGGTATTTQFTDAVIAQL